MLSVTTCTVFSFSGWPFTVSVIPGGLPSTMLTGCFSRQVLACPAGTMPSYRYLPLAFFSPTQQSLAAVSVMTASGGAGGWVAVGVAAGAVGAVGCRLGFAAGRSVSAWVAAACGPCVETRW